MGTIAMDGCEIEAQCSIIGIWCHASITIDVIEHCQNMYADDPTSLVDSTQKLFLFCKWHRLVN